jgi:putative peptide maturation system protein
MVPLVNHCLIRREIARRGIKVSDEQLQEAVNDFRSCRGLQTATETETWLREHGLTLERLEEHLEIEAARGELRRQLTHNALETRFADHRERYDRARVARIKLDSPSSAGRFVERATTGSKDLFEAVERASRDGDRLAAIELAVVVRGQLPDAVSAQIFAASPPPFVGPFKSGDGCDLFRVLGRMPAELDAATGDRIRDELFDEWLTERRRSAQVEWYWGQHRPC